MNNLKKIREENNLTEKEIAKLLKVPKFRYLSWENDLSDIPSQYLFSLSYLYGVGYDELLNYEKPDALDYSLRRMAVQKKYTNRITRIWIWITVFVALVAALIVLLINLAPQMHAKSHAEYVYHSLVDNIHETVSDDTDISNVIYYANKNSGLTQEQYMRGVAILTFDRRYIIFYMDGGMQYMHEVTNNTFLIYAHGNVTEDNHSSQFEVVGYSEWNYLLIRENGETPLADLVLCYKESLK